MNEYIEIHCIISPKQLEGKMASELVYFVLEKDLQNLSEVAPQLPTLSIPWTNAFTQEKSPSFRAYSFIHIVHHFSMLFSWYSEFLKILI